MISTAAQVGYATTTARTWEESTLNALYRNFSNKITPYRLQVSVFILVSREILYNTFLQYISFTRNLYLQWMLVFHTNSNKPTQYDWWLHSSHLMRTVLHSFYLGCSPGAKNWYTLYRYYSEWNNIISIFILFILSLRVDLKQQYSQIWYAVNDNKKKLLIHT